MAKVAVHERKTEKTKMDKKYSMGIRIAAC